MTWRRLRGSGRVLAAMAMAMAIAAAAAAPSAQGSREQAAAQLRDGDARERAAACAVLAESGKPQDLPALQARLYDEDARVRQAAEAAIWAIWSRSGDAAADRLFNQGVGQMGEGRLRMAADTFSRVISMKPDFTEAWNKRATVYFLLGEDDLSLKDCEEVLRRNPRHFGVLAGFGQIYLRKGDLQRALEYFERALDANPNMSGVQDSVDALREIMVKRSRRFI